jgi:NADPH:quinone reductase-like Zn-dependent oxidoreductase
MHGRLVGWPGSDPRLQSISADGQWSTLLPIASPEFGNPRFPLSDVPLSDIAAQVQAGQLDAAPVRVFTFDEIKAAQNLVETGEAGGKVVVVLD